jgi:hypothetical protein
VIQIMGPAALSTTTPKIAPDAVSPVESPDIFTLTGFEITCG